MWVFKHKLFVFSFSTLLLSALHLNALEQDPAERWREALRTTTLQLRTAQNDLAAAQVQSESLSKENTALRARLEKLTKEGEAQRTVAEANIGNLNAQLSDRNAEVASLAAQLKQWKDAYAKAAAIARSKEQERLDLAAELRVAERDLGNMRTKNMELYRLGNDILERYEDFGLGRAIKAREPFTGLARVKLQNLVQEYREDLSESRALMSARAERETATESSRR